MKNIIQRNLNEINDTTYSGIIRVRFDINCEGNTGNYDIQCFDNQFQKTKCNDLYSRKTMSIIQSFKFNSPLDYDGNIVDCRKFYSVQLINGRFKNLMPK